MMLAALCAPFKATEANTQVVERTLIAVLDRMLFPPRWTNNAC